MMVTRTPVLAALVSMALVATPALPKEGPRHLVEHMKIQIEVTKPARSAPSFTVRVGPFTSLVRLKDRFNPDEIFAAPFVDELRDGIAYYLSQKGIKVVEGAADLQVAGRITDYQDFRGGGAHGADLTMQAAFLRHGEKVYEQEVRSHYQFRGEGDATGRVKPAYKEKTGSRSVDFPEVLFTRIAADLGEKIYIILDQERKTLVSRAEPTSGTSGGPQG